MEMEGILEEDPIVDACVDCQAQLALAFVVLQEEVVDHLEAFREFLQALDARFQEEVEDLVVDLLNQEVEVFLEAQGDFHPVEVDDDVAVVGGEVVVGAAVVALEEPVLFPC